MTPIWIENTGGYRDVGKKHTRTSLFPETDYLVILVVMHDPLSISVSSAFNGSIFTTIPIPIPRIRPTTVLYHPWDLHDSRNVQLLGWLPISPPWIYPRIGATVEPRYNDVKNVDIG